MIAHLFNQWLTQTNKHKHGQKVKNNQTGEIYILACTGQFDYSWINIKTGASWGENFDKNSNPLEKLKFMDYTYLYETPVELIPEETK